MPSEIIATLAVFAPLFSQSVWLNAQTLVLGAILCHGTRTVTAALRVMGRSAERRFTNYHRVLNRATWSGLQASQILFGLILAIIPTSATIVLGADDTIERRRGKKIKQIGVYRDAVRSSKRHVVKCFGLKWVSMMVLVKLPFSRRVWALPFLTTLGAPAPKQSKEQSGKQTKRGGKNRQTRKTPSKDQHKTSIDIVGQMVRLVRRWLPARAIVLVVDGAFAAVKLAQQCRASNVVMVSRIKINTVLYHRAEEQPAGKRGPKPKKGKRQRSIKEWAARSDTPWESVEAEWYGGRKKKLKVFSRTGLWYRAGWEPVEIRYVLVRDPEGKLKDEVFMCTDTAASAEQILEWVVMRWSVEVTFEEGRAHLGVETQRQWSDKAIGRTTPVLFGLFTIVTLEAMKMSAGGQIPVAQTAWYQKEEATFSDCLALVRRQLWKARKLVKTGDQAEVINFPSTDFDLLIESLPLAA